MKTVKFKNWICHVEKKQYAMGRPALVLHDVEDGQVVAKATINIPDLSLVDGQVVIKNYSENEGMLNALIKARVVSHPIGHVQTGFEECPICWLLI